MANNPNQDSYLQHLMKGVSTGVSRVMSSVSDDTKILKQVQATHAHDARDLDVKPVLDVVEDIFHCANINSMGNLIAYLQGTHAVVDVLEEKMGVPAGPKGTMLEALAVSIRKVCCEFTCKCTAGDAHASAMAILTLLGGYSWDAKVVITLAAFAVTYGELWLVILLNAANPLARSIAVLKQTPEISEINGVLKPELTTLSDLTKVMVDVARSLIEFRLLPSKYITPEDAPLATSMNHIASAAYWTIRSIVACGARVSDNIGITSGLVNSTTEAWDLSTLAHKEKTIHEQLVQRLVLCHEHIEERKRVERYNYLTLLFKTPQKDNLRVLKSLFYYQDDIHQPLVNVSTKKEVSIDVLQGKTILLFISDLDVSEEELDFMNKIYKESRKNKNIFQYEIVWVPVVDIGGGVSSWTKEHENRFKELQYKMSWYTLFHPSVLDSVSIKFIKEVWGFAKKQIVVSLDMMGNVVSQNALHMMLIWGNAAYPFTTTKEEELWKKETWKLDFVVDAIHPEIPKWIAQGNTHICLFGGEDIEWIRKFTTSMKEHATKTAEIKIELVYVGKHNAKEAVKKIMATINSERLAHTLPNLTQVWYFWTRLESMLYSKMHHGKSVENDKVVKEVMSLLSFDGGDQGWGFIGTGGSGSTTEIVKGKGDVILSALSKFNEWGENSKKVGFVSALVDYFRTVIHTNSHHCNRLILPAIEGAGVPRVVTCADCGRPMEKYVLYRCCTGY